MTRISVIIPTFNRADKLKDALACLLEQKQGPGGAYEVIVVDNNSKDHTRRVTESFMPEFKGRLRYFFEPRQGRTFALNCGINKANGDIITCVDDDCLLEKDHLLKIDTIFAENPGVGFIGGKILPEWLGGKHPRWLEEFLPGQPGRSGNADWLNEFFCGPLGILDYGDEPFVIDYSQHRYDQRHFYGANISFLRSLFDDYGLFDENSILVEDTEMCIRLLSSGVKARYSPELRVFHKIKTSGVHPEYYYKWYWTKGKRREIVEKYTLKFYHPCGIQLAFLQRTAKLFWLSYMADSFKQKMYLRCQALFNVGQMAKIVQANLYKRQDLSKQLPSISSPDHAVAGAPKVKPIAVPNLMSVIVCTRNRSASLKETLQCLLKQECRGFDYEVLVVDNSSVDDTAAVAKSMISQFNHRMRYFYEPRPGKPYALNLGLKEARGEIVVSTDDDCILQPDYLANIYQAFQHPSNDIGFIGGSIVPHWVGGDIPQWLKEIFLLPSKMPGDSPNWFKMAFEGPLGILDYGTESFVLENGGKYGQRLFYGANMAFKKELFTQFGDYRLDKTITQDTEICLRLLKGGIKGLYAPNVRVAHKIKTHKISPAYYYRWYFGRGQYLEDQEVYQRKIYHPLGIQFTFVFKTLDLFGKSFTTDTFMGRVHYRCQAVFNVGQMIKIAKRNIV